MQLQSCIILSRFFNKYKNCPVLSRVYTGAENTGSNGRYFPGQNTFYAPHHLPLTDDEADDDAPASYDNMTQRDDALDSDDPPAGRLFIKLRTDKCLTGKAMWESSDTTVE